MSLKNSLLFTHSRRLASKHAHPVSCHISQIGHLLSERIPKCVKIIRIPARPRWWRGKLAHFAAVHIERGDGTGSAVDEVRGGGAEGGVQVVLARELRQLLGDLEEEAVDVVRLLGRRFEEVHVVAARELLTDVQRNLASARLVILVACTGQTRMCHVCIPSVHTAQVCQVVTGRPT